VGKTHRGRVHLAHLDATPFNPAVAFFYG
jgi:hypothetical protein